MHSSAVVCRKLEGGHRMEPLHPFEAADCRMVPSANVAADLQINVSRIPRLSVAYQGWSLLSWDAAMQLTGRPAVALKQLKEVISRVTSQILSMLPVLHIKISELNQFRNLISWIEITSTVPSPLAPYNNPPLLNGVLSCTISTCRWTN